MGLRNPELTNIGEAIAEAVASGMVRVVKRREGPVVRRIIDVSAIPIPFIETTGLKPSDLSRQDCRSAEHRLKDERDRLWGDELQQSIDRANAMAIAQVQPHRLGEGGDRRTTPFGRFCEDYTPVRLGDHCYHAGERYAEIVREEKNARGILVMGGAPREPGFQVLTEEQLQARKDLAIGRLREANETLVSVMPRLPRAMERLVYDQLEPSIYDFGILRDGLVLLAKKFGIRGKRFGEQD